MPRFNLPARITEFEERSVARLTRNAERDVAEHALDMWARKTKDEIDTVTGMDVLSTQLDEETMFWEKGVSRIAGTGSDFLVASLREKLTIFSTENNRRFRARFTQR